MLRPTPGGDQFLSELAQLQQASGLVLAGHTDLHYLHPWHHIFTILLSLVSGNVNTEFIVEIPNIQHVGPETLVTG